MAKTSAELLMKYETRVSYGPVPDRLHEAPLHDVSWQINGTEFLFRAMGDHYFFYRRGDGIRIHRGPGADLSEESLWLNGSVYVAVASMNGLIPIHASAVTVNGSVYAFTGSAGSGKSTLVAALGAIGLPMVCDDTLILDPADPDRLVCLPGHKRLKLTPEAIGLTGAKSRERVSLSLDKFYCDPPSGKVGVALPLAELIFLEEGPDPEVAPITGYERFARMRDEHYTAHIYAGAQRFDRKASFAHAASLAGRVQMARFIRPRVGSRFHEGVSTIVNYLSQRNGSEAFVEG